MARTYTFNIADRTGHTEEVFDMTKRTTAEVMERFDELVKGGRVAFALEPGGTGGHKVNEFDPNAEDYLFHRPMQGG